MSASRQLLTESSSAALSAQASRLANMCAYFMTIVYFNMEMFFLKKSSKRAKKKQSRSPRAPKLVDLPLIAPDGADEGTTALFAAADPFRRLILEGMVKSNGRAFDPLRAILMLASHISLILVQNRQLQGRLAELHAKLSPPAAEATAPHLELVSETMQESQSGTDQETHSELPDDHTSSSHPIECEEDGA